MVIEHLRNRGQDGEPGPGSERPGQGQENRKRRLASSLLRRGRAPGRMLLTERHYLFTATTLVPAAPISLIELTLDYIRDRRPTLAFMYGSLSLAALVRIIDDDSNMP